VTLFNATFEVRHFQVLQIQRPAHGTTACTVSALHTSISATAAIIRRLTDDLH